MSDNQLINDQAAAERIIIMWKEGRLPAGDVKTLLDEEIFRYREIIAGSHAIHCRCGFFINVLDIRDPRCTEIQDLAR